MSFDREKIRRLRDQIANALKAIEYKGDENGPISIKVGNARYTDNSVTFSLEVSTINDDGSVNTTESEDFKRSARRYGLDPQDLGRSFVHAGSQYKIVGCKPRSRKYPIICECAGARFKFAPSTVKDAIRLQQPPELPIARPGRHWVNAANKRGLADEYDNMMADRYGEGW